MENRPQKHVESILQMQDIQAHDMSSDYTGKTIALGMANGPIWRVSFSHPKQGNFLATCSFDNTVDQNETSLNYGSRSQIKPSLNVNGFSWAPPGMGFAFAACTSNGKVCIFQDDNLSKPRVIDVATKTLNSIEWRRRDGAHSSHLVCGGAGGSLYTLRYDTFTEDYEVEQIEAQVHTEVVRDIRACPSIFTSSEKLITVADDKTAVVWDWTEEGLKVNQTIQLDKTPYRISWSFTGLHCFIATSDGVLCLTQDKNRTSFLLV